jgi:hypothetical protein
MAQCLSGKRLVRGAFQLGPRAAQLAKAAMLQNALPSSPAKPTRDSDHSMSVPTAITMPSVDCGDAPVVERSTAVILT